MEILWGGQERDGPSVTDLWGLWTSFPSLQPRSCSTHISWQSPPLPLGGLGNVAYEGLAAWLSALAMPTVPKSPPASRKD